MTSVAEKTTVPEETPVPKETPVDVSKLVDSRGKHDLRTAMIGLERGGYSKGQIAAIMGEVITKNDTGRFTPKEISDVARNMVPENPRSMKSTAKIKEKTVFGRR